MDLEKMKLQMAQLKEVANMQKARIRCLSLSKNN